MLITPHMYFPAFGIVCRVSGFLFALSHYTSLKIFFVPLFFVFLRFFVLFSSFVFVFCCCPVFLFCLFPFYLFKLLFYFHFSNLNISLMLGTFAF